MKKRNLLVSLKFNVELSKVAYSFLSSIHNKIILLSLIKKIRRATQNKRELEIRKEQIKEKIALNKYHNRLKINLLANFKVIVDYYHNQYMGYPLCICFQGFLQFLQTFRQMNA